MATGNGSGTTITFGTSGFTGELLSLDGIGFSFGKIDTTHMGTTNAKTSVATARYEQSDVTAEVAFDPAIAVPKTGVNETITVDFANSGKTWASSGRIGAVSIGVPLDERMTAKLTLHMTGEFTQVTA